MACKLSAYCSLIFGILRCILPEDTIDLDLKACYLQGLHTYKKYRITQVIKCIPCIIEFKPFPSLQKKMAEFLRNRQIITIPFANRSYQPGPKAAATRNCNLVTLTRPNREKLMQSMKVNLRPFPLATQQKWLANLKAKEMAGATTSLAPTQTSQPGSPPSMQFPISPMPPNTEHTKYSAICTHLGKICPIEFPMSLDWDKDLEEEERKDQNEEYKKYSEGKTPQTSLRFSSVTTCTS